MITKITSEEIPSHLEWLKSRYLETNFGEEMSSAEEQWWKTWMTASVALGLAYRISDCFIYTAPQEDQQMSIIAVRFPEKQWGSAGILYAYMQENHKADSYVPLGKHWFDMLPFVRLNSVRKWRRGLRKNIVLQDTECNQSFTSEYIEG